MKDEIKMAVANAALSVVAGILEQPDQYRATMMIATTMNAAISERARSSVFCPRALQRWRRAEVMTISSNSDYFRGLPFFAKIIP
jgi:hypothetical protein